MAKFKNMRDMFDGGGAGRSGKTFEGGPFSNILNALAVRPYGYNQRQQNALRMVAPQPMPRQMYVPSQGQGEQPAPQAYDGQISPYEMILAQEQEREQRAAENLEMFYMPQQQEQLEFGPAVAYQMAGAQEQERQRRAAQELSGYFFEDYLMPRRNWK